MLVTKVKKTIVMLLGATFVMGLSTSGAVPPLESFDKPIRKTVVNLGRSRTIMPNYPARIKLSCFYYPGFMVKERNVTVKRGYR